VLANTILIFHFAIVSFIVGTVPLIYLGAGLRWSWVRDLRLRVVHLGAIVFVAAESFFGIVCPLTLWEDNLRGTVSGSGFIERWVHRIMFYRLPTSVFTAIYIAFAVLVFVTWILIPPIRPSKFDEV
jgi:Protein of Unknown function (DUF2784)